MSKFIIHNNSSIPDIDAVACVMKVIEMGRISREGKQYCYATTFTVGEAKIVVFSDLNKDSDRFTVVDD